MEGVTLKEVVRVGPPNSPSLSAQAQVQLQAWDSQICLLGIHGVAQGSLPSPAGGHTANFLHPNPSRTSPLALPIWRTFPLLRT